MTNRIEQLETIQIEAKELFRKKNTDYGDAFATYGSIGVLVRIGDKIQRLQSINTRGITLVDDEKLRDTLIDLHNYSAMCIMLLDENKNIKKTITTAIDKKWNITGDSGTKYIRETYVDNIGKTINTCSCPSFMYCKRSHKTCKHINNETIDNEKTITTAIDKKWNITGDSGTKYIRETYVDNIGKTINTCSCPSFMYCKRSHKTCKHINNETIDNEIIDKRWYINNETIDNEIIDKRWYIDGNNNTQYIRETYVDDIGKTVNTCSCPSFIYCNKVTKTCKHIKR